MSPTGVNAIEYAARLVVYIRQIADRLAEFENAIMASRSLYDDVHGIDPRRHRFQRDTEGMRVSVRHAHAAECLGRMRSTRKSVRRPTPCRARCCASIRNRASSWNGSARRSARILGERCHRAMAMRLARSNQTGKVSYGTEAGLFQQMGVPTVILGPGDIAEAHRPNEFVALDQLAKCESFVKRIFSTGYAA